MVGLHLKNIYHYKNPSVCILRAILGPETQTPGPVHQTQPLAHFRLMCSLCLLSWGHAANTELMHVIN